MSDPRFLQDGFDKQLAHLGEEAGELISELGQLVAAIGKTQRWGPDSVNPLLKPEDQVKNLDWIRLQIERVRIEGDDFVKAAQRLSDTLRAEGRGGLWAGTKPAPSPREFAAQSLGLVSSAHDREDSQN